MQKSSAPATRTPRRRASHWGKIIKAARLQKQRETGVRWSKAHVAELAGMSPNTYKRIEDGAPTMSQKLDAVLHALDVVPQVILRPRFSAASPLPAPDFAGPTVRNMLSSTRKVRDTARSFIADSGSYPPATRRPPDVEDRPTASRVTVSDAAVVFQIAGLLEQSSAHLDEIRGVLAEAVRHLAATRALYRSTARAAVQAAIPAPERRRDPAAPRADGTTGVQNRDGSRAANGRRGTKAHAR